MCISSDFAGCEFESEIFFFKDLRQIWPPKAKSGLKFLLWTNPTLFEHKDLSLIEEISNLLGDLNELGLSLSYLLIIPLHSLFVSLLSSSKLDSLLYPSICIKLLSFPFVSPLRILFSMLCPNCSCKKKYKTTKNKGTNRNIQASYSAVKQL